MSKRPARRKIPAWKIAQRRRFVADVRDLAKDTFYLDWEYYGPDWTDEYTDAQMIRGVARAYGGLGALRRLCATSCLPPPSPKGKWGW